MAPGFTRSAIHRILKLITKKKLWPTEEFSQQNKKIKKREKNSVRTNAKDAPQNYWAGFEILKYEFWPFLQQMNKKSYNGHNFCIRRRKNANNTLKKTRENFGFDGTGFTRSAIHRILKFQTKKKLCLTEEFSQQNKKIKKREKNSVAHQSQGCATELLGGIQNFESRPIIPGQQFTESSNSKPKKSYA